MPQRMEVEFTFKRSEAPASTYGRNSAMRILMLGDFSGRGQREPQEMVARLRDQPLLAVDVDTLDAVLTRLAPSLQLAVGEQAGAQIHIDFRSLDDFHPLVLYRRLPLFQYLRQLRQHPQTAL